jgi:hypothetical protein
VKPFQDWAGDPAQIDATQGALAKHRETRAECIPRHHGILGDIAAFLECRQDAKDRRLRHIQATREI